MCTSLGSVTLISSCIRGSRVGLPSPRLCHICRRFRNLHSVYIVVVVVVGCARMNQNPGLPQPGQQLIHVTHDLDSDLENLFNSVMNPKPNSWRKKILPESFFMEPDSGSHSRQSSNDSGSHPPRLGIQHVRSHSSPASLQLGAGSGNVPSPAQQHAHLRQQSYDVLDEPPLPPGWEMAFTHTGQMYFLK